MKLKSILERVYPSSSSNRRSSDFQPLGSFDAQAYENQDPPTTLAKHDALSRQRRTTDRGLPDLTDGRNVRQPAIELKNLNLDQNHHRQQKTSGKYAIESKAINQADEVSVPVEHQAFDASSHSNDRKDFRVYNSTLEEMPPDLCPDEGLPASLLNARLTLGNLIVSGERNVNGIENTRYISVHGNKRSTSSGRKFPCFEDVKDFFCERTSCKESITLVTSTILILLGCSLLLMLVLGKISYGYVGNCQHSTNSDEEALMKQKWPLPDLQSKARNISFDTVENNLKLFSFGHENESDREKLKLKNETNGDEFLKRRSNIFSLGGKTIDPVLINGSYETAKKFLIRQTVLNSSESETLALKGMAGSIFLYEIRKRLDTPEYDELAIHGFLPDDLCSAKADQGLNRHNHENCDKEVWYREISGKCNNVKYPLRGGVYSPLRRILHSGSVHFDINTHEHLSLLADNNKRNHRQESIEKPDHVASALLPMWGIFILHDTLKIADAPGKCCAEDDHLPPNYSEISNDFTFNYARFFFNDSKSSICYENVADHEKYKSGTRWVRQCSSLPPPAIYPSCDASETRSGFNLVTSYIDASNIYGSSREISESLRDKKQGKLKLQKGKDARGLGFLPLQNKTANGTCLNKTSLKGEKANTKCMQAGDADIHENSVIAALHTILVRQHNWIAYWLHQYNRHWDDERIFQESRKILIAQIQHITFNEFLPAILGNDLLNSSGLLENSTGFFELYEKEVDPTPSTAFAYASKLVFYSMLGSKAKLLWKSGKRKQEFWLDMGSLWLQPDKFSLGRRKYLLESLVEGFSSLNAKRTGLAFSQKLRAFHLKATNKTLNIPEMLFERSQALDVPKYMEYRKICGLEELVEIQDFNNTWDPESLELLSRTQKHLEDVDLITGLLAEKPLPSARVGPTMACLMLDQFQRFRRGDRYWWEGDIYFHHFSLEQIKTIRESTLARIICDNTDDNLDRIQKWPMLLPNISSNPIIPCNADSNMPRLKFELWKEKNEHPKKGKKEALSEGDDEDDLGLLGLE